MIAVSIEHAEWFPVRELRVAGGGNLVALDDDVVERYNTALAAFNASQLEIREAEEAQERLMYDGLTWREHQEIVWRRHRAEQAEAQRRDRQQRQWG